ncbi:MAG: SUMF1/EgtB/PvdO family nonheme iron enzyme [Roseomonas sp.]|nr:SUMF1/EgtB/PvdO family nonheme iron enzyme [Roseomonas sp.]
MKVALLVGPSYAEGSGISPLLYARNDAIALGQALREVCRFDRVIVLAGTTGSDAPTRTAIVGELERLADSEEEISHFVFAFSGHGRRRAIAGQDHYFLFPADARASNPGTLLDLATVRLSLERIPAAAITLILDCCRNDPDAGKGEADNLLPDEGLAKDLGIERIPAAGSGAGGQGKALFLMNACSPSERAYENTAQKRGAFFHHLIEGIEGRQWPSGSLTVQEAFTQARDALARNPRYRQTPTFEAPDPSRTAYLAEVGGTGPGLPPRKTNWADRRPWFAAGVATLAVAACAGWLYVERWPWLDARLCAWRAASCEPAQAALAVVTGQLREAERHYEALDRARGQAAAEAAAARVVADQARTSLSAALAAAEQATAARDAARAEAQQAVGERDGQRRAAGEAQARAEAAERRREEAQAAAQAARQAASEAAGRQQAAEARATTAESEAAGLRRDLAAARAELATRTQAPPQAPAAANAPTAPPQAVAPSSVRPSSSASGFPVPERGRFRDCPECPEMVVIPSGSFRMGSPAGEAGRDPDEGPERPVTLRSPLAVGRFEVTFAEWDACVAAGGCSHRPSDEGWRRDNRPVINVSWNDAQQYVAWLSRRTGQRYRLLTEAEWEYAARAGTTTPWHTGGSIGPSQAVFGSSRTEPVGSRPANRFGLHDMHGNVLEWVEDCYVDRYPQDSGDASQAVSTGGCASRVLRGGSWINTPQDLRSALRRRYSPGNQFNFIGFRVARTPG